MIASFKSSPLALRLSAFLILLCAIAVIFQSFAPAYLTENNLHALLRHMSVNGLTAIGLTFVIVVRHFDLSFPGVASLGAMTLGWLLANDYSLSASVMGGIGVGLMAGVINGTVISYLRLPDIVTTIATGGVAVGLSYFYSNGTSISENFFMSGILDLNDSKFLALDMPVVILLATAIVAFVILHCTRFGRAFYATGENRRSAVFSGIRVKTYILTAFGLCGALSCLAITLLVASSGAANVTAGNQLMMPAFAAVYLGAALFGAPSIPATLAGTLLMSAMLNGFTLLAIPYYYSDAIVSTVLILAIGIFDPKLTTLLGDIFGRKAAGKDGR
ncbi:ABC transporter permease [Agrobacterium vitis]|uniref:ABC transporter permease n=1 Tax=Agrobacterium vitis TaxID=373 RepID=UPI001F2FF7D4|nr:ABC transporter permease [Agrobacterium vitis]MCF1466121.1 ABC transporter permease [Agrobacterium vitis]